jgi:hypothetical protein
MFTFEDENGDLKAYSCKRCVLKGDKADLIGARITAQAYSVKNGEMFEETGKPIIFEVNKNIILENRDALAVLFEEALREHLNPSPEPLEIPESDPTNPE